MKLNKELIELIADLEYQIGSECYNPNSYDGWNDIEGCEFRYPINVPDREGNYMKIRGNIDSILHYSGSSLTEDAIKYMKYRFGSNELFIGRGLIKVLQMLEERYDLDFAKMEAER